MLLLAILGASSTAAFYSIAMGPFLRLRRNKHKMLKRQQDREEHLKKVRESYPSVSEEARRITGMELEELAQKLRAGELKAAEVLRAFVSVASEANVATNAIVEFLLPEAEEEAARLDALRPEERGPLHGVPISIKVGKTKQQQKH